MVQSTRGIPVAAALALLLAGVSHAQAPKPPAGPRNLVGNGSFETSFRRPNLWNGVDASGYLAGGRGPLPILTTSGTIADSSMPLSVSVADMNNDGLPDIVTSDILGYIRIFFNKGTATEPKFEFGDLANVFLTRVDPRDPVTAGTGRLFVRRGQRLHATKIFGTGKFDLLIGNYAGEVLALMNTGSVQTPDFRQPPDVARIEIPTGKRGAVKWGNLFAPATWDWNGDGREDLLLGEGSYSANNIHLLINAGSGSRPTFDESNRHILAFGDGLEQLTPAVVDYNGDGKPDLLVAERTGKIAVYLNKGESWKAGEPVPEIPFASFVSSKQGSPLTFGGLCTVATGDLNGDGLFDLVVGKANGRVAVAYNRGSKTEPKFDAPVDLKGTAGTPDMNMPSGWDVDYGLTRGNFLAYVTVVKSDTEPGLQTADGLAALKIGYAPSHNTVMPAPTNYLPALGKFELGDVAVGGSSEAILRNAPARYFMLRQAGRARLNVGKSYIFSMKVRGRASEGRVGIAYEGRKQLGEDRITRGERDSAVIQRNIAEERKEESLTFNPGASWTEVKREFRVSFSNKDLGDLKQTTGSAIQISFTLPQGAELYIDDVKLVEK